MLEVEVAALVRVDLGELVAGHGHARGVRAVRRVGGDDRVAVRLAAIGEVRAHQHQPGELALAPRSRLQADGRQPGDLGEDLLQPPHELERALRSVLLLVRVQVAEPGQRDDPLVHARVVLHRAAAERVEAGVDPEVPVGERREVADELGLGDLGQAGRPAAAKRLGDLDAREVLVTRQRAGAASRARALVDQLHRSSTSARRSISSGVRFSVTATMIASSSPS